MYIRTKVNCFKTNVTFALSQVKFGFPHSTCMNVTGTSDIFKAQCNFVTVDYYMDDHDSACKDNQLRCVCVNSQW